MLEIDFNPLESTQRRQLLAMAVAFALASAALWFLADARVLPILLISLSSIGLLGYCAYGKLGRDIYLALAVIIRMVGWVLSRIVLGVMFVFAITLPGLVLRLFGMDRLNKEFQRCRTRESMFVDTPVHDSEDFRRQS